MAVLSGRVGSIVTVFVTIFVTVIVALHHRMIVVMFFRPLVVMVFRVILGTEGQRNHGSQRKGRNGENYRFPTLMMHGIVLLSCGKRQSMSAGMDGTTPGTGHSMSAGTYANP
jgi:hypothetical protein